jgi:uncharacterized protein YndB with AHSA1/START domain
VTDGQLAQIEEGWELRFTRTLPHRPEKVWRALTEPEHRQAWFPHTIEGEFAPGAELRFVSSHAPAFAGHVLTCDPPRRLEFTWGTDTLRFDLRADGAGTVLTLVDHIDAVGKAARDAAGWHACLDALEAHLSGEQPALTSGQRWEQVHPVYVERFGPEAATIGPPED